MTQIPVASYPPAGYLDPVHGTTQPITKTPAQAHGPGRRSALLDLSRPERNRLHLAVVAWAAAITPSPSGRVAVQDEASLLVVIDHLDQAKIRSIATDPVLDGLDAVLGRSAATGLRAAI